MNEKEMKKMMLKLTTLTYADVICEVLKGITGDDYKFAPVMEKENGEVVVGLAPRNILDNPEQGEVLFVVGIPEDDGMYIKLAEREGSKFNLGETLKRFAPIIEEVVMCRLKSRFPSSLLNSLNLGKN